MKVISNLPFIRFQKCKTPNCEQIREALCDTSLGAGKHFEMSFYSQLLYSKINY